MVLAGDIQGLIVSLPLDYPRLLTVTNCPSLDGC